MRGVIPVTPRVVIPSNICRPALTSSPDGTAHPPLTAATIGAVFFL